VPSWWAPMLAPSLSMSSKEGMRGLDPPSRQVCMHGSSPRRLLQTCRRNLQATQTLLTWEQLKRNDLPLFLSSIVTPRSINTITCLGEASSRIFRAGDD
jgi:hypothetical protein